MSTVRMFGVVQAALLVLPTASQGVFLANVMTDSVREEVLEIFETNTDIREAFLHPAALNKTAPFVGNASQGWNILGPDFPHGDPLDGISFEWEYYMIHAPPVFTGIIGYVLMDPRAHLNGVLPSGLNVAVAGKFGDGVCGDSPAADTTCVMNYVPFWPNGTQTGPGPEGVLSASGAAGNTWASIVALPDAGKVRIEGSTEGVEWSLEIENGFPQRPDVPATYTTDLGTLPNEHWTVHMIWPTTTVSGNLTNRATGEVFAVDGHGYRENSFGRWLFAADGWDFAIFSDMERDLNRGVAWQWQSYHKSSTGAANTVDVSFYDGNDLKSLHFGLGEIGWFHNDWIWSTVSRQCVPLNGIVEAANDDYYIKAHIDIGQSQVALLSDATPVTGVYVINEWLPYFNGTIRRQSDGSIVDTFEGVAGGEISMLRGTVPVGESQCVKWGRPRFARPLLQEVSKAAGGDRNDCPMIPKMAKCLVQKGCRWAVEQGRCY